MVTEGLGLGLCFMHSTDGGALDTLIGSKTNGNRP